MRPAFMYGAGDVRIGYRAMDRHKALKVLVRL
jgi:hypothetical protein